MENVKPFVVPKVLKNNKPKPKIHILGNVVLPKIEFKKVSNFQEFAIIFDNFSLKTR